MSVGKLFTPARKQAGVRFTLALSMLMASLGTSIANIALPALAEAFMAPFSQVQAVVVAYLATMTIMSVVAGRLGDRYGLKQMLIAGLGLFTVAALSCGIAPNLWGLIGARTLQGVGAAFLMTLVMAMMRQAASEARLGQAMGLLGTISALGTALGPALGGWLLLVTGWRGIFLIQLPLALIALILALWILPTPTINRKAPAPSVWQVLNAKLLSNLAINLLVAAVMMATLVIGPFYLGLGLGLRETQVGLVMAIGPVISIFGGVVSGKLVDTLGSHRTLLIGLMLLIVGTLLLALLPNWVGVNGYIVSIIVLTPGYQLFQVANNTAALANVPRHIHGTIAGLLGLARNIGLIVGASVMGAVFALVVGTEDFIHAYPAAIAAGMRLTFLLAGGMMIVAIAIAVPQLTGKGTG